jgi:hypothetical protein
VVVGPPANGERSVDIRAAKVPAANILLAMRVKDLTYSADLPLSGELKGELGRDGLPTYFRGKVTAGAGHIIDSDTPDYPMAIDSADINVEWDSGRRVLVAPFKIISGSNRVTLLAHLEPPNGSIADWQLGFSGGTIVLAGMENEQPLIFNRIAIGLRFDTDRKRVLLTQADISNGEIGIAGTGSVDYSGEARLTLGFAGTPMSASALKRMWPILIVPEVREWVIERVERGSLQRIEVGVNSPVRNLSRRGPPIPDDGLAVNIVATGVTLRPVDEMPLVRDADLKARVTGRTATVTIGQAVSDTPAGRKLNITDLVFEVPDMAPKPAPARVKFRIDGPVPAAAEILASDRLSEFSGTLIDPNMSKGTMSAVVTLGLPIKRELTKADTTYSITADLGGFAADKLVMNQKLEANTLKVTANNAGYQVKGDVKINGQAASLDYRKPSEGDADVRLQATLDDASRARLGLDLGSAVSGALPVKLTGKIGGPDRESRLGIEADLTALRLDNILPGWVKMPGKSSRAVFNVVRSRNPPGSRTSSSTAAAYRSGLARGRPEQRPDQRQLPDLFALRRRQELAEGRARPGWHAESDDARRRVRRPWLPQVGHFGQGRRRQEQDQEHRSRCGRETRCGGRLQWRGGAQRRFQAIAAQRRHQELYAERQAWPRHAADGGSARPRPGPRADLSRDQRCRRIFAIHRHLLQGGRRPAHLGHGSSDGRSRPARGPDQRPRLRHQGGGFARSRGRRRDGRPAERRFLLASARRIYPAERAAQDPGGCPERPDDWRDHRRQHRYPRQPGAHERHLRADVRAEQHVRPDSDRRPDHRRRQQ